MSACIFQDESETLPKTHRDADPAELQLNVTETRKDGSA